MATSTLLVSDDYFDNILEEEKLQCAVCLEDFDERLGLKSCGEHFLLDAVRGP